MTPLTSPFVTVMPLYLTFGDILQVILAPVILAIFFGYINRRSIEANRARRRARKAAKLAAQEEAARAAQEASRAAQEARNTSAREIYLSALSGQLMAVNEANRGNPDRTALVALAEICRRLRTGNDVPKQMILHTLSRLKGTEEIISRIERAGV